MAAKPQVWQSSAFNLTPGSVRGWIWKLFDILCIRRSTIQIHKEYKLLRFCNRGLRRLLHQSSHLQTVAMALSWISNMTRATPLTNCPAVFWKCLIKIIITYRSGSESSVLDPVVNCQRHVAFQLPARCRGQPQISYKHALIGHSTACTCFSVVFLQLTQQTRTITGHQWQPQQPKKIGNRTHRCGLSEHTEYFWTISLLPDLCSTNRESKYNFKSNCL